MRPHLLKLTFAVYYGLLSLVLTWPTLLRCNEAVLGSPDGDGMKHLWTIWWFRRTLLTDHGSLFENPYFNHPAGMEFWPIEPLNGLLSLALGFVPLIAAVNLIALLNLALVGLCGHLLGAELSRDQDDSGLLGGLLAGTLLQASSFALFSIHVGVGELQHFWMLPLGLFSAMRLHRSGSWGWALATGAILGLGTIACFYHGLFLALGLLVLGAWSLLFPPTSSGSISSSGLRLRGRLLLRWLGAAGLAVVLVLPTLHSFATSYGQDDNPGTSLVKYVVDEGHGQPLSDPPSARLQPEHLVMGRSELQDGGSREDRAYGGGRLLGIPLLLLVALSLVRRPSRALPLLLIALVGLLLSLGSYLSMGGEDLLIAGRKLRLPFLFFNRVVGFAAEPVHFPVRFLALTHVALVGIAALAPGSLGYKSRARLAILCLGLVNPLDVHFRQSLPYPLPSFIPTSLPGLESLDVHRDHAILDLAALWRPDVEERYVAMSAQMLHAHPFQAVPIERLEFYARDGHTFGESLELLKEWEVLYSGMAPAERSEDMDRRKDLFLLRHHGFHELLVTSLGGRGEPPRVLIQDMSQLLGEPSFQGPNWAVFEVPEVQATEQEKSQWLEEHRAAWRSTRGLESGHGPQMR